MANSALFVSSAGASTERKVTIRSAEYLRCALNSICSRAPFLASDVIRISAVKSLQPFCVIIRSIITPASGSGAGVAVMSGEESLGAFEVVSAPHPQSDAHSRISRAIFLGCIYLSESLFVSIECSGIALEYRNPRQTLNVTVSVTASQKGDGAYFAFRGRVI